MADNRINKWNVLTGKLLTLTKGLFFFAVASDCKKKYESMNENHCQANEKYISSHLNHICYYMLY